MGEVSEVDKVDGWFRRNARLAPSKPRTTCTNKVAAPVNDYYMYALEPIYYIQCMLYVQNGKCMSHK